MNSRTIQVNSEDEMIDLGRQLAAHLPTPSAILLSGDLGAGKTTLTKGIALGLGVASPDEITSPTFTLIHEYGDPTRLFHIDLYRLDQPHQLFSLGLDEILDRPAITVIEWPDKFRNLLPTNAIEINICHHGDARLVTIPATSLPPAA